MRVASIAQVGTDNVTPLDTLTLAVLVLPKPRIMTEHHSTVITTTAYTGLIPGTVSDLLAAEDVTRHGLSQSQPSRSREG